MTIGIFDMALLLPVIVSEFGATELDFPGLWVAGSSPSTLHPSKANFSADERTPIHR